MLSHVNFDLFEDDNQKEITTRILLGEWRALRRGMVGSDIKSFEHFNNLEMLQISKKNSANKNLSRADSAAVYFKLNLLHYDLEEHYNQDSCSICCDDFKKFDLVRNMNA